LRAELTDLGFTHVEDRGGDDIDARYLVDRDDGLKAGSVGPIVIARR
jgi:hypothetical protein